MNRLSPAFRCCAVICVAFLGHTSPETARADWELTDNFSPVTTGFALNRRWGWWDDGTPRADGQIVNVHKASTMTPNADVILNNTFLPSNFPTEVITPLSGDTSYYEVVYNRPFTEMSNIYDPVGFNRTEWTLGLSDAVDFPDYSDISQYDNVDPNIRGRAQIEFDYKIVYIDPSDQEVPSFGLPFPNTHPADTTPFHVDAAVHDVPVSISMALMYRDFDFSGNPDCTGGDLGCWQDIAASGVNFDTVPDDADSIVNIIDEGDYQYYQLIADGQVHTQRIDLTILTSAERKAEQWLDQVQGEDYDPLDPGSQNTDTMETLRFDLRGGGPRIVVLDNFRLSALEPAPGDFNNDGIVDAADYTVFRDNEGTSNILPNDPTPGVVDSTDYDLWVENFGWRGSIASSPSATVPEPTGVLAALMIGISGVGVGRRR